MYGGGAEALEVGQRRGGISEGNAVEAVGASVGLEEGQAAESPREVSSRPSQHRPGQLQPTITGLHLCLQPCQRGHTRLSSSDALLLPKQRVREHKGQRPPLPPVMPV